MATHVAKDLHQKFGARWIEITIANVNTYIYIYNYINIYIIYNYILYIYIIYIYYIV